MSYCRISSKIGSARAAGFSTEMVTAVVVRYGSNELMSTIEALIGNVGVR